MTKQYDADLVAQNLRGISPDLKSIDAFSKKHEGMQPFMFWTKRLLATDEMVSLCQKLAAAIRRDIPERPDGWAVRLLACNIPARPMGDYYLGWTGRADEWHLREGQERKATDAADWAALRERLRAFLITLGAEGKRARDGEFFLVRTEGERHRQTLFIRRPEFLTKDLIASIQKLLSDGYPDWVVHIAPAFGPPLEALWRGLDVHVDGIEEKWDRQEAEKLLGDRLKI